jgi:hypothetical protein
MISAAVRPCDLNAGIDPEAGLDIDLFIDPFASFPFMPESCRNLISILDVRLMTVPPDRYSSFGIA